MRLTFTFVSLIFLFTQCGDPFTTHCYEARKERPGQTTVIFFSVTTDGKTAHGTQSTTVTQADGKVTANASGTFQGTCANGECFVDYQYESNGETKVAEEEFRLTDGVMRLTAASYRLENGKEVMKERGLFNMVLEKVECP